MNAMTPRETVWLALSDLFLDTDVTLFRDHTLTVLHAAPFDLAELERIFIDEVYPVCIFNLFDIAGEWAGFSEAWLFPAITCHRAKWQPFLRVQRRRRMAEARKLVPEWFEIRDRLRSESKI